MRENHNQSVTVMYGRATLTLRKIERILHRQISMFNKINININDMVSTIIYMKITK